VDEREEAKEGQAREDRDRLDRQEDKDPRSDERQGDGRGRHLASSDPGEHPREEAVAGHAERRADRRGEVRVQGAIHGDDADDQEGLAHIRLTEEVRDADEDHVLGSAEARIAGGPPGQHRGGNVSEDREEETGVDEEGHEEGEEHAAGHTRLRALHLIRQLGDHLEALEGDEQDHGAEDERERPADAARWDAAGRSSRRQGEETHEDQPYNQENFS